MNDRIAWGGFCIKLQFICKQCGRAYYADQNQAERTKYCSDACFRKSKDKRIEYACDYCGKIFLASRRKYLDKCNGLRNGIYCSSQCAKDVQKPLFEEISNEFEKHGYELLSDCYESAKTKLEYICPKHREFGSQFITYNNLRNGCGCRYCGREAQSSKRRLSFRDAKEIFAMHNMTLLDQEYINSSQPLKYICNAHPEYGIQYMTTGNARRQHCPHCNVIKGEDRIAKYLLLHDIEFRQQVKYDSLIGLGGGKLSYDFYLPTYNLLIEYQGEFHDGTSGIQTQHEFKKQVEHDKRKREYAKNHNINLLEIWYYDFSRIEEILDTQLNNSIINLRDCDGAYSNICA